jgi:hypothetical protein
VLAMIEFISTDFCYEAAISVHVQNVAGRCHEHLSGAFAGQRFELIVQDLTGCL